MLLIIHISLLYIPLRKKKNYTDWLSYTIEYKHAAFKDVKMWRNIYLFLFPLTNKGSYIKKRVDLMEKKSKWMTILKLSEFGKNEDASAGVTGVWETLNDLTR